MRSFIFICCIVFALPLFGQKSSNKSAAVTLPFDTVITNQLQFRNVGPWRGGRSAAVTGDLVNKQLFYFGATGGGVWKTIDGGNNWSNISDGYFGGSVGAVAVSKSDPTILYAGLGEETVRGNVSEGTGMWKSENGGHTWKFIGLNDTRHITRIVIHPKNPDIVYCAALGHLFGPNTERGIFRSTDGGANWEKILFVNENVGACDLIMDPADPTVLLCTFWNVKRTPYSLESGGPGSGIYKTTDGGDNWINITPNKGLPKDTLGIIGITIAPSDTKTYYSIVESKTGGVFKSKDAGKTWEKVNSENKLRQRAWYFSRIYCDPQNENTLYVLNVEFWKSIDGGKTFTAISTPHGDHHDLWIDPQDPKRMIIGDDGGAQISYDGGKSWSTYYNQPTAQIYRVSTDNDVPYHLLGAQQDNSSVRIAHRSRGGQIDGNDWEPTAGFESGTIVADPNDYNAVYGGNYSGYIGYYDHLTGDTRNITVWPNDPIGQGMENQKYRFQWNFPLFFSPNDPTKLYAAGNVLFSTTDGGTTWNVISPDLTTNDKSKQQPSGGVITKDNTGVEVYCTIFAAAESPVEKDVIYTGSDDGLIYVTKNGGKDWTNITPKDLPALTMINCIEPDPVKKGKMYFAGTRYKLDDASPYLYVTEDYGATWRKIITGIDNAHFTRVIRADKVRSGLLYCGTERGLYISYDDGGHWFQFQQNLPIVPITDITIKNNDLILATQGRGFWMMDDISALQDDYVLTGHRFAEANKMHVYPVRAGYRISGYQIEDPVNAGKNPLTGVVLNCYINAQPADSVKSLSIRLFDAKGQFIDALSSNAQEDEKKLNVHAGYNSFNWNYKYPKSESAEGMFLWNGAPDQPKAAPGEYYAWVKYDKDSIRVPFSILPDPHSKATAEDYILQHDFLVQVQNKFNETQAAIKDMQSLQGQMNDYINKLGPTAPAALKDSVTAINKKLNTIIEALYETKNKSNQDMLNNGIKLNDKLAGLYNAASSGNFRPSQNQQEVLKVLSAEADQWLAQYETIKKTDIVDLNAMIDRLDLPVIVPVQKQ